MRFWWLNYGDDIDDQMNGRYVALPLRDSVGVSKSVWKRLREVQPGDLIIGCVERSLATIIVPEKSAERETLQIGENRRIAALVAFAEHLELENWVDLDQVLEFVSPAFPEEFRPWDREPGRFGEIHPLSDDPARSLLEAIDLTFAAHGRGVVGDAIVEAMIAAELSDESIDAIDQSRFGTGPYRDAVVRLQGERCQLSGMSTPELLHVSHIKGWVPSSDQERLDGENGLVLAPSQAIAFEKGLFSFADDGALLVSDLLEPGDVRRLGLTDAPKLDVRSERQRGYLAYHRQTYFRS